MNKVSVQGRVSNKILESIANEYDSTMRVLFEFIDNAIDDADDNLYDLQSDSYKHDIDINVIITKDEIIVQDNCTGMRDIQRVVTNIGDSSKKSNAFSTGQFGFGIHSFLATSASKLIIESKRENEVGQYVELPRETFKQENENFKFDFYDRKVDFDHGTRITFKGMKKGDISKISIEDLKKEIEVHFNILLCRQQLNVVLQDKRTNKSFKCETINYDQWEGTTYDKDIKEISTKNDTKKSKYTRKLGDKPIKIFLKVTPKHKLNKPPVFIIKGRRICEIADAKQYKSINKSLIWRHDNITGYIDLSDHIEPKLNRHSGFKNTDTLKAVFKTLIDTEAEIFDLVNSIRASERDEHYDVIGNEVTNILNDLLKEDNLQHRKLSSQGEDNSSTDTTNSDNDGGVIREGSPKDDPGVSNPGGFGDGSGGNNHKPEKDENPFADENDMQDKKGDGLKITFLDGEPMEDEDTNQLVRSQCTAGEVGIFKEHPDFISRSKHKNTKKINKELITQRLVTYIAGEVTVHAKDLLAHKRGQTDRPYNKEMYINLMDFVYKFEDRMQFLVGKNADELQ